MSDKESHSGLFSRYDRWFWRIITAISVGCLLFYVTTGGSRWGIVIIGSFAIIGMLLLRADWLSRHPDDEVTATRGTP